LIDEQRIQQLTKQQIAYDPFGIILPIPIPKLAPPPLIQPSVFNPIPAPTVIPHQEVHNPFNVNINAQNQIPAAPPPVSNPENIEPYCSA
jgi:hypothetical protein